MRNKKQILEENQSFSRPSTPFEEAHRLALTKVHTLQCAIKGQNIYVAHIVAEKGGGAAGFRELFILYREKGLTGDIFLHSVSSDVNLFFLYMGMIPFEIDPKTNVKCPINEIKMDYLKSFFANPADTEIARLGINKLEIDEKLSDSEKVILKKVLFEELTRVGSNKYDSSESVSDDDLTSAKGILVEISNKQVSQLEAEFMPALLRSMRQSIANFIAGGAFSSEGTNMREFHMTKMGFERAFSAIVNGEKIQSFRNLEHLPLPQYQRNELQQIIDAAKPDRNKMAINELKKSMQENVEEKKNENVSKSKITKDL